LGWEGRKEKKSRVEGGEEEMIPPCVGGEEWGVGGGIRTREEEGTGAYLLTSCSKHKNFFEN